MTKLQYKAIYSHSVQSAHPDLMCVCVVLLVLFKNAMRSHSTWKMGAVQIYFIIIIIIIITFFLITFYICIVSMGFLPW